MNCSSIKTITVVAVLFLSLNFFTTSCKKTSPANATITVVDSLNKPIKGAKVVLRQDSVTNAGTGVKADIYDEKITDIYGNTHHSFKWEAVLNVEVTYGKIKTLDYIRLEQSKSVGKTIVLK